MTIKTNQIVSTILAGVNILGTIGVLISTTKQAPKAKKEIDDAKALNPNISKGSIAKIFCKSMALPITLTAIAAISGGTSTIISRKTEMSLGASIIALEKGYQKYSWKIKDLIGKDKKEEVMTEIAKDDLRNLSENDTKRKDGRVLYWLEHVGFFLADPELVALSYADINQRIQVEDYAGGTFYFASLKNFLVQCDAEILDKNILLDELDNWGWSIDYLSDMFEYYWIHMHWDDVTENGRSFRKLYFEEEPVYGYQTWADEDRRIVPKIENISDGQIETPFSTAADVDVVDPNLR